MSISISTALHESRLAGVLSFLDTGTGNSAICIYGGTRPSNVTSVPGSNMLVQIGLTKPAGTIASELLTLTPAGNGLVAETGTPTWARVVNGNGATAFDCDVGYGVGAWEIQLTQPILYANGDAVLQSATLG